MDQFLVGTVYEDNIKVFEGKVRKELKLFYRAISVETLIWISLISFMLL